MDYSLLAQACHRGGRVRGEAFNYFCMGVLYDNLQVGVVCCGDAGGGAGPLRVFNSHCASVNARVSRLLCVGTPLQDYTSAIECYQKFLRLCQHSQDQQGEMLALNAIGVSYQQMGLGTACAVGWLCVQTICNGHVLCHGATRVFGGRVLYFHRRILW